MTKSKILSFIIAMSVVCMLIFSAAPAALGYSSSAYYANVANYYDMYSSYYQVLGADNNSSSYRYYAYYYAYYNNYYQYYSYYVAPSSLSSLAYNAYYYGYYQRQYAYAN